MSAFMDARSNCAPCMVLNTCCVPGCGEQYWVWRKNAKQQIRCRKHQKEHIKAVRKRAKQLHDEQNRERILRNQRVHPEPCGYAPTQPGRMWE